MLARGEAHGERLSRRACEFLWGEKIAVSVGSLFWSSRRKLTSVIVAHVHERAETILLDPVDLAVGRRLGLPRHFALGGRLNVASDDWDDVSISGALGDELLVLLEGAAFLPKLVDAVIVEPAMEEGNVVGANDRELEVRVEVGDQAGIERRRGQGLRWSERVNE